MGTSFLDLVSQHGDRRKHNISHHIFHLLQTEAVFITTLTNTVLKNL